MGSNGTNTAGGESTAYQFLGLSQPNPGSNNASESFLSALASVAGNESSQRPKQPTPGNGMGGGLHKTMSAPSLNQLANASRSNQGNDKKRKSPHDVESSGDERGNLDGRDKKRLVWTAQLHQRFVNALFSIGVKSAAPRNILEEMKVEGLTTENIKSHLQKYRLYLKSAQDSSTYEGLKPDQLPQQVNEVNGVTDRNRIDFALEKMCQMQQRIVQMQTHMQTQLQSQNTFTTKLGLQVKDISKQLASMQQMSQMELAAQDAAMSRQQEDTGGNQFGLPSQDVITQLVQSHGMLRNSNQNEIDMETQMKKMMQMHRLHVNSVQNMVQAGSNQPEEEFHVDSPTFAAELNDFLSVDH